MTYKKYDDRLIAAFLSHYKVADIIKETGLSKNTIYKYKNDPDFQKILQEYKSQVVHITVNKMQINMTKNFDKLQKIIDDPNNSPQVTVNAIQLYASQLRDWLTVDDIMKQLDELKASIMGGSGHSEGGGK